MKVAISSTSDERKFDFDRIIEIKKGLYNYAIIELDSLQELIDFVEKLDIEVIIYPKSYIMDDVIKEYDMAIEIYDDYRE